MLARAGPVFFTKGRMPDDSNFFCHPSIFVFLFYVFARYLDSFIQFGLVSEHTGDAADLFEIRASCHCERVEYACYLPTKGDRM